MNIALDKVVSANIILNCVYSRKVLRLLFYIVIRYNSQCGLQVLRIDTRFYLLVFITFSFRFYRKRQIKQILVEILGSS